MTLTELQVLIGSLTNDPNHDRYSLTDIGTELDNVQSDWNIEIKIVRTITTLTTVDGQRQYPLSTLTGTTIAFGRVTHKGLLLEKRDKHYFDLYSGTDWTQDLGTPREYCVEASDPANCYVTLHPTPQSGDAGANLVVETILAHSTMSLSTDVPFSYLLATNSFLRPYDFYLAFNAAARLLARDPSEINSGRAAEYLKISSNGKANLIQVFKALEAEEPKRMSGGRYWNSGNVQLLK